jgi:GNAT superfamily N-acetyltransferase
MQKSERIEIRLLFESDIPAAMKLKEAARWNQTEDDWRRLLMLEPNGCFGAIKDGRLVGTTTTTTYDNDLAWIGMVLVDPEYRRLGIATRLMRTVLDYLKGRVETVKLDATPQGRPVYERLGFEVESLIERWSGMSKSATVIDETAKDVLALPALFELDCRAFNADRSKLIRALIEDESFPTVLAKAGDGTLSGYALARTGSNADYVGPIVSTNSKQVDELVDRVLSRLSGRRVYIDFNTECRTSPTLLAARGFVKERDLIRMSSGKVGKRTSPFVVAIAGPEVG